MSDDNHDIDKEKGGHLVALAVFCNVFEQSRYPIDPFGKNGAEMPYGPRIIQRDVRRCHAR